MTDGFAAVLAECDRAMDILEARCCDPGRSPRMAELRATLAEVKTRWLSHGDPSALLATIEKAGAQIGSLQVTCCAPSRMPLYDKLLHGLMEVQRAVPRQEGHGH